MSNKALILKAKRANAFGLTYGKFVELEASDSYRIKKSIGMDLCIECGELFFPKTKHTVICKKCWNRKRIEKRCRI